MLFMVCKHICALPITVNATIFHKYFIVFLSLESQQEVGKRIEEKSVVNFLRHLIKPFQRLAKRDIKQHKIKPKQPTWY